QRRSGLQRVVRLHPQAAAGHHRALALGDQHDLERRRFLAAALLVEAGHGEHLKGSAKVEHLHVGEEGVLASVEIWVATPQNVETLCQARISTRRRNHPCGRYDGFDDKGKTWS